MHPTVNHLIQLQELTMIRDEQQVTPGSVHLQQLDTSIQAMIQELPRETHTSYEKLHKKDHVVIVPVSDGFCAGCGMRLPISLVQAVRLAREIHVCPNCARMLYYPEFAPRRKSQMRRRTDPPKVGISKFSSHTLMVPRLESTDCEGVIRELATKMEHEGFLDKADRLVELALRREAILSTAVDHGVAFPHVREVEGGGISLALGLSKKGIKFDSTGKSLTHIVVFLVIPTASSAFYLKLLAGLTETFVKPEARKALLDEEGPDELWKTLVRVTKTTIK